jgi:hypothetical protein
MGEMMSEMMSEKAKVSHLPSHSGDGYGYGGGVVLTIGGQSILLGDADHAFALAQEIARRWNQGSASDD